MRRAVGVAMFVVPIVTLLGIGLWQNGPMVLLVVVGAVVVVNTWYWIAMSLIGSR